MWNLSDLFNCIEADFLYLSMQKTPKILQEKIMEIRYDLDSESLKSLKKQIKNKIEKIANLKNISIFVDRYRSDVYRLREKCFDFHYQRVNKIIKKLSAEELKLVRFIMEHGKWRSVDVDIINVIFGVFKACHGNTHFLQSDKIGELLVKLGININARIINGKINEWVEIQDYLWSIINKTEIVKQKRSVVQESSLLIDDELLKFSEILLKTMDKDSFLVSKAHVRELYKTNFGKYPTTENVSQGLIHEDDTYYYICPSKMSGLKKRLIERKKALVSRLIKKINLENVTFDDKIIAYTSNLDGIKIIISPWVVFPKPSPMGRDPPETNFLSINQPVMIITNMQGFNLYVREIEESQELREIMVVIDMENSAKFYIKSKNHGQRLRKAIKEIYGDTRTVDATCKELEEFYPKNIRDMQNYAERKLSIEDIYVLSNIFGIDVDYDNGYGSKEKLVEQLFKKIGTKKFPWIIGYPSVIRCENR